MQLVINTRRTSLRRKGDRFLIKSGDKQVAFSAQKVQSIVIATGVHFSSDVIHLAAEHNVDVVFLDRSGQPISRVWQTKLGSTATIRRRQIEAADKDDGLQIVRQWIETKITNQLAFLRELERRRTASETTEKRIASIAAALAKLPEITGTIDEARSAIMAIEAQAGRAYFACLGELLPQEYRFETRSRQPATDPFNATLNYAYGVLYSQVERALILAGLDPFVGFLHTDNYNKRSLVFDMIEPFRIIAERISVLLFTGRRMKKDYFREIPGGIELSPDGRAALMTDLNKRLDKSIKVYSRKATEPDSALDAGRETSAEKPTLRKFRRLKQRTAIQHEAHATANLLLGRHDIPRIVETEVLLEDP